METSTQINLFQVAEVQVTYTPKFKISSRPHISSSKDIHEIFRNNWTPGTMEHHEELKVMLLNRANRVLGIYTGGKGGIAGVICDPKMVFQAAILANASSIILAHNHPSGNLKPSPADLNLTKKIKAGADLMDIVLLDHLILTEGHYFSFADEGLL